MFKPMLAGKAPEDLSKIKFPVLASPKLDGIRCLHPYGKTPVTRTFKRIPNKHIDTLLSEYLPEGFDGELISGDFNETQSAVMSVGGEPDFEFHVFDYFNCIDGTGEKPFMQRLQELRIQLINLPDWIIAVPQIIIRNVENLETFEESCIVSGYEGVMIRDPKGPYKCGRSTVKEGYLLKIKRFEDNEGIVIGYEELMHNGNEAEEDAFGRTKRSSSKEGKTGKDTLGKLIVLYNNFTFGVGTGFNDAQRKKYWEIKDELIGKTVTFKHQKAGGKGAPRFPVFKGFRKEE